MYRRRASDIATVAAVGGGGGGDGGGGRPVLYVASTDARRTVHARNNVSNVSRPVGMRNNRQTVCAEFLISRRRDKLNKKTLLIIIINVS